MKLINHFSNFLLVCYKVINKTGVLRQGWAQSAFISSYFTYKKYLEDSTAKLVKNYPALFKGGYIIDIGANIGYTAYVFSKALSPSYQVLAFEPEANNLNILKKAAITYDFAKNVTIVAAAVGNEEGEIELWQNDGHHADHRILTDEFKKKLMHKVGNNGAESKFSIQKIPLVTIDGFLKNMKIKDAPLSSEIIPSVAMIKIDVQGYEMAVCQGMQKTLNANPNCVVIFEYCPSIMKALGFNAEELIRFFQEKNYLFYRLNKAGRFEILDPLYLLKLGKSEYADLSITSQAPKEESVFKGYFDIICSQKNLLT